MPAKSSFSRHFSLQGISKNCFFIPNAIKLFVSDCEFSLLVDYIIDVQYIKYWRRSLLDIPIPLTMADRLWLCLLLLH